MRIRHFISLIAALVLTSGVALGDNEPHDSVQQSAATSQSASKSQSTEPTMQRFVIERDIPGAGRMTAQELSEAAAQSNKVLRMLGPDIQWVQSYVTGDKLYCVYNARSAELIKEHAAKSGFPANRITPVAAVIDPTTAH